MGTSGCRRSADPHENPRGIGLSLLRSCFRPGELRFSDLDSIALESNYDRQMQFDSARPWFLKRRIMGGHGHLSNLQALAAIRKLLDRSRRLPDHIVLLHRSQECNCPHLVRQIFSADPRIASRLTLAEQHERSPWLGRVNRPILAGEQLKFAF